MPGLPCVWSVVLMVSIGVRSILKQAAASDTKTVFSNSGNVRVYPFELRRARIPALAAVSPNRDIGP